MGRGKELFVASLVGVGALVEAVEQVVENADKGDFDRDLVELDFAGELERGRFGVLVVGDGGVADLFDGDPRDVLVDRVDGQSVRGGVDLEGDVTLAVVCEGGEVGLESEVVVLRGEVRG